MPGRKSNALTLKGGMHDYKPRPYLLTGRGTPRREVADTPLPGQMGLDSQEFMHMRRKEFDFGTFSFSYQYVDAQGKAQSTDLAGVAVEEPDGKWKAPYHPQRYARRTGGCMRNGKQMLQDWITQGHVA